MPSLPPSAGGLPPEAKPAPSTGSHLADTGHTAQSHWLQHEHVFDLVCRQCGHTRPTTDLPIPSDETELPNMLAVRDDELAETAYWERARDTVFTARELQAEIDEILAEPSATVDDMPAKTWVLNLTTGMLHDRSNLSERCNTDQIPRNLRRIATDPAILTEDARFKRKCRWCHPKVVRNPDAEAAEVPADEAR